MAEPTREEALATLRDLRSQVLRELARVPEGDRTRPGIGDGDWSPKDLLGHLAFWEELALEAIAAWDRGERPRAVEIFASGDDGVHRANAGDVQRKLPWDYEEVRADADDVHARLIRAIEGMSDEDWRRPAPYPTERHSRMATLLGAIVGASQRPFGHASAHLPDLTAFVGRL